MSLDVNKKGLENNMPDKVWSEVPSLAIMLAMLWMFFKYLKSQDTIISDAREAIKENSRMLGQVCKVLERINGKH